MPRKSPDNKRIDPMDDSTAYLAGWAGRLAETLSPAELTRLARDYGRLARNASLSADDRNVARRRATAIRKIV